MMGWEIESLSFWWVFPLAMFILCIFMMRGRKGPMTCGFGTAKDNRKAYDGSETAMDILDKRYALGEINDEEYEEKKRLLTVHNDSGSPMA